jgi:hypothetical protein
MSYCHLKGNDRQLARTRRIWCRRPSVTLSGLGSLDLLTVTAVIYRKAMPDAQSRLSGSCL